MFLSFTRVARNMFGIGSTISTGAFGFSLASSKWSITKVHNLNVSYAKTLSMAPEDIKNVNDIEDFEQSKGCKFLFYNKGGEKQKFEQGDFDVARTYSGSVIKVVEAVKKHHEKCVKGSFVFISSEDNVSTRTAK